MVYCVIMVLLLVVVSVGRVGKICRNVRKYGMIVLIWVCCSMIFDSYIWYGECGCCYGRLCWLWLLNYGSRWLMKVLLCLFMLGISCLEFWVVVC